MLLLDCCSLLIAVAKCVGMEINPRCWIVDLNLLLVRVVEVLVVGSVVVLAEFVGLVG